MRTSKRGERVQVLGGGCLFAAIAGEVVGTLISAPRIMTSVRSVLLTISTLMRAGITLVVLAAGHRLEVRVVPDDVFAVMMFVAMSPRVVGTLSLRPTFRYLRRSEGESKVCTESGESYGSGDDSEEPSIVGE